jgi:hypothetical protein
MGQKGLNPATRAFAQNGRVGSKASFSNRVGHSKYDRIPDEIPFRVLMPCHVSLMANIAIKYPEPNRDKSNTEVYPSAGGTIKRPSDMIIEYLDVDFDHPKDSPYRTALARYLWASIDSNYWAERA